MEVYPLLSEDFFINTLPVLLIYFVPGFIFMLIRNYLMIYDEKENMIFVKSILISYILLNILILPANIFFDLSRQELINSNLFIISLLLFSLIVSILFTKITKSKCWYNILIRLGFSNLPYNNIWSDIESRIRDGYVISARIYLDRFTYVGVLDTYETNKKDNYFIMMTKYKCYDENNNLILNEEDNKNAKLIVNTKDVDRFELNI